MYRQMSICMKSLFSFSCGGFLLQPIHLIYYDQQIVIKNKKCQVKKKWTYAVKEKKLCLKSEMGVILLKMKSKSAKITNYENRIENNHT